MAQEFANQLVVPINCPNKVLKEVAGKPTSVLITSRITDETRILLHHLERGQNCLLLEFCLPHLLQSFFQKADGYYRHPALGPLEQRFCR
jgi:hypothetical protein